MAQQLKTKNLNVVAGQLFYRQRKANILRPTVLMIKIKFNVTDTDNEFAECKTPRKKLQSIGISPVSLHAFMKTLSSDISEAYKVQVDCFTDSESILMKKMI